mgnify:CR=1 FL=1
MRGSKELLDRRRTHDVENDCDIVKVHRVLEGEFSAQEKMFRVPAPKTPIHNEILRAPVSSFDGAGPGDVPMMQNRKR